MFELNKVAFNGWPHCYELTNGIIKIIVTSDIGPRIVFYGFVEGENQFYLNPSQAGLVGGNDWFIYGGHRLWQAPEDPKITYAPDNFPVEMEQTGNGIRLVAPVESSGIQKHIELKLDETSPKVTILHSIKNMSSESKFLAPWALSVMRQGGIGIFPQPKHIEFPDRLTPTHSVAMWGYTRMSDPRWVWGDRYIFLRQDPNIVTPQKFGYFNDAGWAAYLNHGELFVKRFGTSNDQPYPDLNCNFEAFTNNEFLELESLGPLQPLEPGVEIHHEEVWNLFKGIPVPASENQVDKFILPLLHP